MMMGARLPDHDNDHKDGKDQRAAGAKQDPANLSRERLATCYLLHRHQVNKGGAGDDINEGHNGNAVSKSSWHCSSRIANLASHLTDIPPARKREERAHYTNRQPFDD